MTFGKARQRARKRGKRGFFLRDCAATNGLLNVRGFWSIKRKEGEERGVLWPPEVVVELRTVAAN